MSSSAKKTMSWGPKKGRGERNLSAGWHLLVMLRISTYSKGQYKGQSNAASGELKMLQLAIVLPYMRFFRVNASLTRWTQ